MTDQDINIAIAEACGLKSVRYDYCHDLNAMHEAEKAIPEKEIKYYAAHVWQAMEKSPEVAIGIIHATARQRAEAFLRTLNKWEE
jgi:hypothetical protein